MLHNLFPTTVYQHKLTSAPRVRALNQHLFKEAYILKRTDKAGRDWSKANYRRGFTTYGSLDRLHELSPYFQDLSGFLNSHVTSFLKLHQYDCKRQELRLNSMWVNIMPSGAQHSMHTHPHSVVSGTYYVVVDPKTSPLKFEDPRTGLFMNSPLLKSNAEPARQRFFSVRPKIGDVVLFDSWLKHEVPENSAKTERVSVSFNYDWN